MYIRNSVSYKVVLYGSAGLKVIVVSLSKGNFKLRVYSIDPPLPHLLFLIICVTFYFLLSSHFSCQSFYSSYLCDLMTSFSRYQVVDTPTHISPNGQSILIDLVFVSNLHSFSNCSVITQLSKAIQVCFPGCNAAVHTEVCAPGKKQLTFAYLRDYTVDQEES